MREARRRPPEGLVEKELPRRIGNVVLAPHHMSDLHQRIVDDDGEVVGGDAAGPQQHEVADDLGAERDLSANDVVEGKLPLPFRHAEADDGRFAVFDPASSVLARIPATLALAAWARSIQRPISFQSWSKNTTTGMDW